MTTTTTEPKTPAPAIKKVSLGGLGAAKKKDTKTQYPVFVDTEAEIIAARIIENQQQFEALEGALKIDKAELKQRCSPFYFQNGAGKAEVPSSVAINSEKGEVLVCFQNRYSAMPDETTVARVLKPEQVAKYFTQSFEIKIDGAALPEDTAAQFIEDLQALAAVHGCTEAISTKDGIKPVKDFHVRRHLELTPAENLAMELACPIIAMVKTKGRGK